MRHLLLVVPVVIGGCDVSMGPSMLQASLFLEMRDAAKISALCPSSVPEAEVRAATPATLKVDNIQAKRSLFGKNGHGTAHVEFRTKNGPPCTGTVEFDFAQDSRVTGRTRRSVQTSNDFYYSNVTVKRQ